jgi:hypothetical protein
MFFGFGAMSSHIVVVSGAGRFQFVDGIEHVVVDSLQVVPVAHLPNRDSRDKRDTQ